MAATTTTAIHDRPAALWVAMATASASVGTLIAAVIVGGNGV